MDFEIATIINEEDMPRLKCGTPGYMAPEVIKSEIYNEKVDVYSCGILLFFMYLLYLI